MVLTNEVVHVRDSSTMLTCKIYLTHHCTWQCISETHSSILKLSNHQYLSLEDGFKSSIAFKGKENFQIINNYDWKRVLVEMNEQFNIGSIAYVYKKSPRIIRVT